MKADLTTPGSFAQTQARNKVLKESSTRPGVLPQELKSPTRPASPDYKLDLSSKAPAAPSAPGIPSSPSLPSLEAPGPKAPEMAKEVAKEQLKSEATEELRKTVEPEVKAGSLKKDAIIFIKGLDVFSSPSKSETGYAGLGRLAESVEGSRIYGWSQKEEIIKEINKVHPDYKVVLVGHSLGGDTAMEIANELDTLENKFRGVDLLVTIDAVGFGNDIVGQNVKNHLNIFGERDYFLNDGPHVARRNEMTTVKNILSPLDHTEIDDDKTNQFEIVSLIEKTLNKRV